VENLWQLDDKGRATFISAKLRSLKKAAQDQFSALLQEYQKICNESEDTNNSLKVDILKQAKVVGFTITGLLLFVYCLFVYLFIFI
jgi:sulfate adenylyltransferase subunit 1 (EFTu-like GTPase family)